jgi:hypothetical protein
LRKSLGRGIAQKVEARGQILFTDIPAMDVQRSPIKTVDEMPSGIKLRFDVNSERLVRERGYSADRARHYCIGTIAYLDQGQARRETGFCFVLEEGSRGPRWVRAKSREYEYAY